MCSVILYNLHFGWDCRDRVLRVVIGSHLAVLKAYPWLFSENIPGGVQGPFAMTLRNWIRVDHIQGKCFLLHHLPDIHLV